MEGIKKTALVTGASSGFGLAISKKLLEMNYEVYGIGRTFQPESIGEDFHAITLDLLDSTKLLDFLTDFNKTHEVSVLINNAGVGFYGLHETLKPADITAMVRTNLEIPMIISNILLKNLKSNNGFIINISSHTASKTNPHGCAYGATKAGITSFSKSLFEEERKYGLKVIDIEPDMSKTNLYRNADFHEDADTDAYLTPEEIADAVEYALSQRDGCIVTQISLMPKLNKISRKK